MNLNPFSIFKNKRNNKGITPGFVEKFAEPSVAPEIPSFERYELDEIATKKGLEIYKKMRLDDQVRPCSDLKKSLILSSGWKIEGENVEQRTFIEENINGLPKAFSKKVKNILTAFDYGFSVTEIVYKRYNDKIYLKNLKTHQPFDLDFTFDNALNIVGVNIGGSVYPPERFIIYSFSDEFDNPYGNSDLKSSYSAWFFKQIVWRFWASHLEGFGSPLKVGHIPASASVAEKDKFEKIIQNIHFRTGILLPRSEINKEEFSIELLESKREGGTQFRDAITNADERIARSLLFPRLFGLTGEKFGSYALGSVQFEVVYSLLEELQNEVADELNKQLITRLLKLNFPEQDNSVKLVFLPPNREIVQNLINIYIELVKNGILEKDEADANKIKQLLRI